MMAIMGDEPSEETRRWRRHWLALTLIAVPLAVIAAMALRTIHIERTAGEARNLAAARERGAAVGKRLEAAVTKEMEASESLVLGALAAGTNEVDVLRRLVSDGAVAFAVHFRGEGRAFPPEDPTAALLQEILKLAKLAPALSLARSHAKGDERGLAWSAIDDLPTLVSCRVVGEAQTLCLALPSDQALRSLAEETASNTYFGDAPVEIVDPGSMTRWRTAPEGGPLEPAASIDLVRPLEGWKIRAAAAPYPAFAHAALGASVLAPVAIGWGVALWSLFRRQADAAAEERRRAECAARLSHDLRTPLSNLLLYVDLIARHGRDTAPIGRYCAVLEEEIARLGSIAEEAVHQARGEPVQSAGTAPLILDAVVGALIVRYEPLMREAGCAVAFSGGAGRPARLDGRVLERIVVNLLDNARRHAAGSRVSISTTLEAERFILRVRDDGVKGGAGDTGTALGFGLGLKVVGELAATCGGTFAADIRGGGASFEVALPVGEG
ncbi:sensor histidine kinase [Xanthobacter sp. AM11]|nr:HAMP domain-containing sensor histidine kinase [Xanthobacter autotrophicus]MDI4665509.1 HAMP domain-containing histidine kinase [Xanthobacter autotrophicus]